MNQNTDTSKRAGDGALFYCSGYSPGHPWYYKLGGNILGPKSIIRMVIASEYQGYRADELELADRLAEPKRSNALRDIRQSVLTDYWADLARYRILAGELRRFRRDHSAKPEQSICSDIHTNMSLKYCHLYNDLAHLNRIDELLSVQRDLFDEF